MMNERFKPKDSIKEILKNFTSGKKVSTSGRVTSTRNNGLFFDIKSEGKSIQCLSNNETAVLASSLKIGDIVGVEGSLVLTKTSAQTIQLNKVVIVARCQHQVPKGYYSVKNVETLTKERVLHIILDDKAYENFMFRSHAVKELRDLMHNMSYTEVETPILHPIPGGAEADPFSTFHNATKKNLFLRIAPELYLKRMVTAGFGRVFEIGKVFRNEGISTRHNPEFTMMEAYTAYEDLDYAISLTEKVYNLIYRLKYGESFNEKWSKISFEDAVYAEVGFCNIHDVKEVRQACKGRFCYDEHETSYEICERIIDKFLLDKNYVHLMHHPKAISPLAKSDPLNPKQALRFESFVNGMEISNGYEELTDPDEQEAIFMQQNKQNNKPIDEQYINDMRYGMPNMVGLGIGIDRIIMVILGVNMRDVIMFKQT